MKTHLKSQKTGSTNHFHFRSWIPQDLDVKKILISSSIIYNYSLQIYPCNELFLLWSQFGLEN